MEQLNLGIIIAKLEMVNDKTLPVCFDFGSAIPTCFNSYRGSYSDLALGYTLTGYDDSENHFGKIEVKDFLEECKSTIGKTFEGWKGGEFTMDGNTRLWVSNSGNADKTGIYNIEETDYEVILHTTRFEF